MGRYCRWVLPVLALMAMACRSNVVLEGSVGRTPDGVAFEVMGTGDPVVLIHGFSLDRRMWDPQLFALVDRYRVISYDLRGHGTSEPPTGPYSAYDDLGAVLDALDIDEAAVVGHSAGAQVAIDFALLYPGRVTKLVLISPGLSGYVPREPFMWFQPVGAAIQAGDLELAMRRWAETPLMAVTDSLVASRILTMVLRNRHLWSYQRGDQPPDPPAVTRLSEITVPTLIIVGQDDLANIHGVADTLTTCVPGARRLVIPRGRHMVNMTAPTAVNEALRSFLREPTAGGRSPTPSPCA